MSAISLKSITGITSITTPAGVDNQLTLHTNDTTQRVKVTESGVEVSGVTTTANIIVSAGSSITIPVHNDNTALYLGDSFTVPNASGSVGARIRQGSTTSTSFEFNTLINTGKSFKFVAPSSAGDLFSVSDNSNLGVRLYCGANNEKLRTVGTGITVYGTTETQQLNVSGHTNLDNVSIAGVCTATAFVLENGTVFLNKHSVGIGTTTQDGRNAGVSTATGTIIYNAETEKVQVYANAVWRNVGSLEPDQSSGFYSSLSAAQAAGLSHYWPGNSSTSLISGLQPDDRKGNPTFNNKEHDGYGATNPFFHFAGQTGGDNPTGYRYTHSEDWVGHSFSITYWVKVMQEITEGESTYVQLGNHSGTRSMFAMSSSGSTNLIGKTITIGDDNANDQIQYEFNNWIHVGVRYNYGANSATYYKNGVQTENHTFNQSLSVGTGNNNIYLGYGYWNSSTSNKESCSRMSDIGIWDSTSINGGNFMEIYKAGRIVKGY